MSVTNSTGQKSDIEAISELTTYLRAVRTVGWSKHLDRPSDNGQHLAKNLNRNFAVLQLCLDNGRSIGLGWLGVSGDSGYSPPAILNKPIILASRASDFFLNVKELLGLETDTFLEPHFAPLPDAHMKCAEIPLLNGLGVKLATLNVPNTVTGSLYLLTERLPCPSCGHVLRQFQRRYPTLKIHLLYMFDHTDRAARRLNTDLSELAASVHLVEVIDDGDKGFVGLTGAVFGSASKPALCTTGGNSVEVLQSKSCGITINLVRVSALRSGDEIVVPTSKESEVISRGAGSPSAHFISNILPAK